MKIADITTPDIQRFYDTMQDAAHSTVKHMKDVLHQIFDSAIEDGIIVRNPTDSKRLVMPKKANTREALTQEQVRHIEQQMVRLKKSDQLYLKLLIYTGARRGEILGLKWSDISLKENAIHIQRAVVHIRNRPLIGETKSKSGTRIIPLLPQLKQFLLEYEHSKEDTFVIGNDEEPITETAYRRMYERIDKKIELYGATAHVFKHTFLTMAATSVDPKTLQAIAGHANYTLTMSRYVHKRDDKIKESGKKLSNIYS